jgi:branched-chain amino acid transport system substrate-binding protein
MKKDLLFNCVAAIAGFCLLSASLAEEGVTETEIIIGTQLDLSGPIVSLSVPLKNGMNMKVREINEAGGIHGRKLKLIIEDHGYDPKKAVMVT